MGCGYRLSARFVAYLVEEFSMSKWVWMEEYKTCSCSQIERKKSDLLGYCSRHGHNRRYVVKLPAAEFSDDNLGFVET